MHKTKTEKKRNYEQLMMLMTMQMGKMKWRTPQLVNSREFSTTQN